ncbi:MAG: site-specific integrase [Chloroflexota bacterium]|nr:site-specific integrase [Chloroflexota bacterium]
MVVVTGQDGRRIRRKPKIQTPTGAERLLRQLLKERDEGSLTTGSMTLRAFVPQYIEAARARNVRPRTIEAYEEKLNKHVVPTLGGTRLDKLTAAQVERLYGEKLAEGLSPSTVGMVHQVLHSLLKLATRRKLVGYVVTGGVDPPKRAKYQARSLALTEARAVLKAIKDHRHGPLWTFIRGTGCRFGEAVGLSWADVDLDEGIAAIRQQVTRERTDGHVTLAIRPVKTDAGYRSAPLAPWVVAALRAQRARVAEMRLVAGPRWRDRDLVFPNRDGGPLAENHVLVSWHRALKTITLPDGKPVPKIRMHDLRHTKGTLMIDEGEELLVVQRTLGHARQSITADLYVGKVPKALRRAADRFGELLDPEREAAV